VLHGCRLNYLRWSLKAGSNVALQFTRNDADSKSDKASHAPLRLARDLTADSH
jgi:hypothetical protein